MIVAGLPYPFDVEVKPAGSLSLRVLKISLTLLLADRGTKEDSHFSVLCRWFRDPD